MYAVRLLLLLAKRVPAPTQPRIKTHEERSLRYNVWDRLVYSSLREERSESPNPVVVVGPVLLLLLLLSAPLARR